jgi:RNA polymerase sigma-70 factor (ECF subfamily)
VLFSKKHIEKLTDEALILLMDSKKKNLALEELYKRYSKRILGYFVNMFQGDVQKAQDFTQDVFIRIAEKHHQFNPDYKLYTWIFTIASNLGKSSFRNNVIHVDFNYKSNIVYESESSIDHDLFKLQLKKSIENLEPHHREIYILRYLEELTVPEISDVTNTPLGTVKSRLFYANKIIVEQLKEFNPKKESYGKIK